MANTVTIDERDGEVILHVKYGESICSDCHTRQLVDSLNKELDAWRKKASALEGECDEHEEECEELRSSLIHQNNVNSEQASQLADALNERDALKAKYEDAAQHVDALEVECADLLSFVRDIRGQLCDNDVPIMEARADGLIAKYGRNKK